MQNVYAHSSPAVTVPAVNGRSGWRGHRPPGGRNTDSEIPPIPRPQDGRRFATQTCRSRRGGRLCARVTLSLMLAVGLLTGAARAQTPPTPSAPLALTPQPMPALNPKLPTLFIVGDSTVKNSGTELGWGTPIADDFDATRINVVNRARGGRSSRTFQTEGLWDQVLAAAKPGDFLLVQMGHNDGGPVNDASRARGSIRGVGDETQEIDNLLTKKHEVVHTYGWYMSKYVTDARAHGMTPIVLSPVPHCPRAPVQTGDVERSPYVGWAAQVAQSQKALFIDLNRIVMSHYVGLTPDQIKARYFTPADNTHSSPTGAELNASCVVEGLRALPGCPLIAYLKPVAATLPATAPAASPSAVVPAVPAAPPARAYTMQANIAYDKYPQTVLDIMQPTAPATGRRPGVIMFHGGGWVESSKETMMRSFCLPYIQQGYVVCNVEYRLAPAAPAPAAVSDALDAAAWFFGNAAKYNVDPERIVVTGASAGGHLALMVGMTPAGTGLGPAAPVAAIVDCYGPTDVADLVAGPHHKSWASQWVPDAPDRADLAKRVSPLTYVRKGLPPMFIAQGAEDTTVPVDQSVRLTRAMHDAGDDVQMITVPGAKHGFSQDQWVGVHQQIFDFLRKHGISQ